MLGGRGLHRTRYTPVINRRAPVLGLVQSPHSEIILKPSSLFRAYPISHLEGPYPVVAALFDFLSTPGQPENSLQSKRDEKCGHCTLGAVHSDPSSNSLALLTLDNPFHTRHLVRDSPTMPLSSLPTEIHLAILPFLTHSSLTNLKQVNKHFFNLVSPRLIRNALYIHEILHYEDLEAEEMFPCYRCLKILPEDDFDRCMPTSHAGLACQGAMCRTCLLCDHKNEYWFGETM
jgi:hypothetical protein